MNQHVFCMGFHEYLSDDYRLLRKPGLGYVRSRAIDDSSPYFCTELLWSADVHAYIRGHATTRGKVIEIDSGPMHWQWESCRNRGEEIARAWYKLWHAYTDLHPRLTRARPRSPH